MRATVDDAAGMEMLVQVALAEAEILQRLGRVREAQEALQRLLLDEATRKGFAEWKFRLADAKMRIAEVKALADPRIQRLRERLEQGRANAEAGTEGIEQTVRQAFAIGNPGVVHAIGPRAAPALEQLVLSDPDHFPKEAGWDPLVVLLEISELRGAALIAEHHDAGGFFWKKRIVRAMEEAAVLRNEGTWQESRDSGIAPRLLEAGWLPILGRLVHDRQIGRDALGLVGIVAYNDALSEELQTGLILALSSPDPDMVHEVLRALKDTQGKRSVEPVLIATLDHPDPEVRRFGAEALLNFGPSPGLVAAAENPDPLVRRAACLALRSRRVIRPNFVTRRPDFRMVGRPHLGEAEKAALLGLVADPDPEVRFEAVTTLASHPAGLVDAELWRRLAADPAAAVRAMSVRIDPPDLDLRVELMTVLAHDPDPRVLAAVDDGLAEVVHDRDDAGRWMEPYLPVLAARRGNAAAAMDSSIGSRVKEVYAAAARSDAGLRRVARWALAEGDDELLLLLIEKAAWDADETWGANVGMGCLEDGQLMAIYARAFELSEVHFDAVKKGIESLRPRRDEALRGVLQDTTAPRELRVHAAAGAAEVGGAAFLQELRALILDPSWGERAPNKREASWLRRTGRQLGARDAGALVRALAADPAARDEIALMVVSGVADGGGQGIDTASAQAVLDRWYAHPDAGYVVRSAFAHLAAEPGDAYSALLLEAVRDPELAYTAIQALGRLGHAEYLPTLGACLRAEWIPHPDMRKRAQRVAIDALGDYLDDEAAAILLEGLGWFQDEDLRERCFQALGTIRRYQEERESWDARRLRQEARERAVAQLLVMLESESSVTRMHAVRSLAALGAVEHLPTIVRMLGDEDFGVSTAAQEALEILNGRGRSEE